MIQAFGVLGFWGCLLNLRLSQGPIVKKFEKEAASYMDVNHAVAMNSGTSANMLALASLMNLGMLKIGDEVIVPAATFSSVVSPIYQLGLVPVYVDVSKEDWFLDIDQMAAACSEKTKVIMPVYNLGFPGRIEKIIEFAADRNIRVLEDCCEAHGGERQGTKLGAFGDVSALSFFVAHNITTGEGGMVFSSDPAIDNSLRELREFGRVFDSENRFFSDDVLSDYDVTAETAVSIYDLDIRNRDMDRIDKKQALVKWWARNKKEFKKYNNLSRLAELLNLTHCSIIHLDRNRKPSHSYKENTLDINEFLKS